MNRIGTAQHRFENLGRTLDRYWDGLRINAPYWPVMVHNLACWVLIPNQRFFPEADIPGMKMLSENWETIRDELTEVLAEREQIPAFWEIDPGQRRLTDDHLWKMFVLRLGGVDVESNRDRCPQTAKLLDEVPGLFSAYFSIISPGKRIPIHAGALKGIYRAHIALIIPEGDCWIEVGGERRHWVEGDGMVFDDTYLHQVQNNTPELRAVLFMDIVRPMPQRWLDRLNRWMLGALSRSGRVASMVKNSELRAESQESV